MAEEDNLENGTTAAVQTAAVSAIIDKVTDYLRYKSECGDRVVELDNDSVSMLFSRVRIASSQQSHTSAAHPPSNSMPKKTSSPDSEQKKSSVACSQVPIFDSLGAIATAAAKCRACGLCDGRIQVVPGQGNADSPDVMFIGEAPGADEDKQGLAFVGRAGQLLTKMIAAMGYTREEIFIANICKCRPPNNRPPTPEEMAACIPFLKSQIHLVKPKTIVAMGNTAITGLLGRGGITSLRGNWTMFEGIQLMPTFHPAYLLRMPAAKHQAWADLQKVMAKLGRHVPPPSGGAKS